jgi:hypothetical protein
METVVVSSEGHLEMWAREIFDASGLHLDQPRYWHPDGRPKKTPWLNPQRKLARSWDRSPPNLVAVGSDEFGLKVMQVLNRVFVTFNNDGWDLDTLDWTSSPHDLNYLVSVVGETYPGWPFVVRNLQVLPNEEASLLARGATEDNLPWYEKDGSVNGDFKLGNNPITIFATTTDLSRVTTQLVDIFTLQLIDRTDPRP